MEVYSEILSGRDVNTSKDIWNTFAFWGFWIGVAFFSVYPTCNWLTSQRSVTYNLYFEFEQNIPFIPEFIWIYLSMYILFIFPPFFLNIRQSVRLGKQLIYATFFSGVVYLLFPAILGFERILPDDPFYSKIYEKIFSVDLPHNLVPSLHVVFSAIIVLSIINAISSNVGKILLSIWLFFLCLSTLLVHQHHILDIAAGLLVAIIFRANIKET